MLDGGRSAKAFPCRSIGVMKQHRLELADVEFRPEIPFTTSPVVTWTAYSLAMPTAAPSTCALNGTAPDGGILHAQHHRRREWQILHFLMDCEAFASDLNDDRRGRGFYRWLWKRQYLLL